MDKEIEVKFVNISIAATRLALQNAGAILIHPMRTMQRAIIHTPAMKQKDAFVRVRHEGHKTTLTYKQFDQLSLDGAKEIEVQTSDFNKTIALLAAAGLPHESLQETRRETWQLHDVEIAIDEWPWLNPYVEIEGPRQHAVMRAAKQLGFDWKDAVFGDVMAAYRVQYPHLTAEQTVGTIPQVRFDDPLPDMLKPHWQ